MPYLEQFVIVVSECFRWLYPMVILDGYTRWLYSWWLYSMVILDGYTHDGYTHDGYTRWLYSWWLFHDGCSMVIQTQMLYDVYLTLEGQQLSGTLLHSNTWYLKLIKYWVCFRLGTVEKTDLDRCLHQYKCHWK